MKARKFLHDAANYPVLKFMAAIEPIYKEIFD